MSGDIRNPDDEPTAMDCAGTHALQMARALDCKPPWLWT